MKIMLALLLTLLGCCAGAFLVLLAGAPLGAILVCGYIGMALGVSRHIVVAQVHRDRRGRELA